MAALDDAIAHLDALIHRLRSRKTSPPSTQNATEKFQSLSVSKTVSVPSEPKSQEVVAAKTPAISSRNLFEGEGLNAGSQPQVDTVSVPSEPKSQEVVAAKTPAMSSRNLSEGEGLNAGSQPPVEGPNPAEDFDKALLQVGQVVSVEEHPVAEKLYVCKVEVAQEQVKQVVAGLGKFVPSSELLGKKVCLVLNLKPAKLAGQLSEAMILAGEAQINGDLIVKILQPPPDASVGDRIYLEDSSPSAKPAKQLSSKIWEKLLPHLHIEGGVAKFNQRSLVTSSGALTATDLPDGSNIH